MIIMFILFEFLNNMNNYENDDEKYEYAKYTFKNFSRFEFESILIIIKENLDTLIKYKNFDIVILYFNNYYEDHFKYFNEDYFKYYTDDKLFPINYRSIISYLINKIDEIENENLIRNIFDFQSKFFK